MNTLMPVLLPWLYFVLFIGLAAVLLKWARQRLKTAIAVGLLLQMLLPDPKVQQTIQVVTERKQQIKKQQDEVGQPLE